ncbi:hypothetical protein B0A49_00773 [Cryomyces minteri]|uniref:Uncharacterized protein n=1 Tax=Cryomyces minteri TaxID=331657 RepID=A0A4U0XJ77_9PEZI|nr:hypothetical protein B0A49_00773 [Cryomyces minteri]
MPTSNTASPPGVDDQTSARRQQNYNNYEENQSLTYQQQQRDQDDVAAASNTPSKPRRARPKQRVNGQAAAPTSLSVADGAYPHTNSPQRSRPLSMSANEPGATPAKPTMAYAGPTFHASPAPSSLPVPKFFSKSVPADTPPQSLQSRLDAESEHSGSSPISDVTPPITHAVPVERHQSPLDIFFNADREEKAKRRSSSRLLSPQDNPSAWLPQSDTEWRNSVASLHQQPSSHYARESSGKDVFMLELDGRSADASLTNPPLASASNEHMGTVRSKTAPPGILQAGHDEAQRRAASQSLKALLFSPSQQHLAAPTHHAHESRQSSEPMSSYPTLSSFTYHDPMHRSASGPATPQRQSNAQAPSLSYGNRNLSPLFHAAKTESPERSSGLRQETRPPPTTERLDFLPIAPPAVSSANRLPPRKLDAAEVSRNYLNAQIEAAGGTRDLPLRHAASSAPPFNQGPPHPTSTSSTHRSPRQPFPLSDPVHHGEPDHPGTPDRASASSAPDVKSMEDDLRRMLKLNALGESMAGVR